MRESTPGTVFSLVQSPDYCETQMSLDDIIYRNPAYLPIQTKYSTRCTEIDIVSRISVLSTVPGTEVHRYLYSVPSREYESRLGRTLSTSVNNLAKFAQ